MPGGLAHEHRLAVMTGIDGEGPTQLHACKHAAFAAARMAAHEMLDGIVEIVAARKDAKRFAGTQPGEAALREHDGTIRQHRKVTVECLHSPVGQIDSLKHLAV